MIVFEPFYSSNHCTLVMCVNNDFFSQYLQIILDYIVNHKKTYLNIL